MGTGSEPSFAATLEHFHGGHAVVRCQGELDRVGADKLDRALREAAASGADRVVLDLRELVFIDSSGLRAIIAADERARRDGPPMSVRRGPDQIQRVFAIVGLEPRLTWEES